MEFLTFPLRETLGSTKGRILGRNWDKEFFSLLLKVTSTLLTDFTPPPPPPRAKVVVNWFLI
jgi:hypothetical protein